MESQQSSGWLYVRLSLVLMVLYQNVVKAAGVCAVGRHRAVLTTVVQEAL